MNEPICSPAPQETPVQEPVRFSLRDWLALALGMALAALFFRVYGGANLARAAAVDLLPVFGVGTVLLPWSLFSFVGGDVYRGVGLLVLFFVMYVVRQFAEPRILGSTIGVHPLFTLFAVFAGFSLFGIWGMVLFPLLLYGVKALLSGVTEEKGGLP